MTTATIDPTVPLAPWGGQKRRLVIQQMFANSERELASRGVPIRSYVVCVACEYETQRLSGRKLCYRCQDRLAAMNTGQEVPNAA